MTDQEYLTKLKEHVDKLARLLADPQPGLGSWAMMFGKEMQAISDLWNKEPK